MSTVDGGTHTLHFPKILNVFCYVTYTSTDKMSNLCLPDKYSIWFERSFIL